MPASSSDSGVVAYVVVTDTDALRELYELCAKWRARKPNSLYVDWEQSLYSYRQERTTHE